VARALLCETSMFLVPAVGPTTPANVLFGSTIVTVDAHVLYAPLLALALVAVVAMLVGCSGMRRHKRSRHRRALLGDIAHLTSHLRGVNAVPAGCPARARHP
jgi:hypothetical protein